MTSEIGDVQPAEDAGTETYRRYRIQCSMALPYVLGVLVGDIERVIMEHIDDFVVLRPVGTVELHQVKTRSDGGRWTLSAISTSKTFGRPLHAMLLRLRLVRHLNTKHVLHLQGPIDKDVRQLSVDCERGSVEGHVADMANRLKCPEAEARELLKRLTISNDVPEASAIQDVCMNRYIFPSVTRGTTPSEAVELLRRLIDRIGLAMEAADITEPQSWLPDLLAGRPASDTVARKTLDQLSLHELAAHFRQTTGSRLVATLPTKAWASALTEKLRNGKSDETLLHQVQALRASAYQRHIEQLTGGVDSEADLADVYTRVMTAVLEVLGDINERPAPAAKVFSGLSRILRSEAGAIDPRRIFLADSNLLLGAAFQMCDECRWKLD